jgi:hypothetical protein
MSRKAHTPTKKTRAEVSALVSFGVPLEEIAKYIGVDRKTLNKWYQDEIDTAKIKANTNVGKFAYRLASGQAIKDGATYGDCSRMAMFWLKTQCGWKETQAIEHAGANGAPLGINVVFKRAKKDS